MKRMSKAEKIRRAIAYMVIHINTRQRMIIARPDELRLGSIVKVITAGYPDDRGNFQAIDVEHPFQVIREVTFDEWKRSQPATAPAATMSQAQATRQGFRRFYELSTD